MKGTVDTYLLQQRYLMHEDGEKTWYRHYITTSQTVATTPTEKNAVKNAIERICEKCKACESRIGFGFGKYEDTLAVDRIDQPTEPMPTECPLKKARILLTYFPDIHPPPIVVIK